MGEVRDIKLRLLQFTQTNKVTTTVNFVLCIYNATTKKPQKRDIKKYYRKKLKKKSKKYSNYPQEETESREETETKK